MSAHTRLLVFGAGLALAPASLASDFTWNGTLDPRDDEWSFPNHWSGPFGLYPSTRSDSALIDGTAIGDPDLDLDVRIGAVTIQGGAVLDTNGFVYSISDSGGLSGDTIIEDAGSLLLVRDVVNNPNDAGSGFIINAGGTLRLDSSGLATVNARKLDVAFGGLVEGSGTLAQLGRTGSVSNEGTLRATGGTMTLQPWEASDLFNWDGTSGDGRIEVDDDSELRIEMRVTRFDSEMTLHDNAVLEVQDNWTLGDGFSDLDPAEIRALTAADQPARIQGQDTLTINGANIDLENGSLIFDVPVAIEDAGFGQIAISGDHSLTFNQPTLILDPFMIGLGSFGVGGGKLIVGGAFDQVRIINPALPFNLDGSEEDSVIEVRELCSLELDVQRIDSSDNQFDGNLIVNGVLDVNVDGPEWFMAGMLEAGIDSIVPGQIRGDRIRVTGQVHVGPRGCIIDARNAFQGSAVTGPGELRLQGTKTDLFGTSISIRELQILSNTLLVLGSDPTSIATTDQVSLTSDFVTISSPLTVSAPNLDNPFSGGPTEIESITTIVDDGFVEFISTDGPKTLVYSGPLTLSSSDGALRGERVRINNLNVVGESSIEAAAELTGEIQLEDSPSEESGRLGLRGGTLAEPSVIEPTCFITALDESVSLAFEGVTRVESGTSLGNDDVVLEIPEGGTLIAEPDASFDGTLQARGDLLLGLPSEQIGDMSFDRFEHLNGGRLVIRIGPPPGGVPLLIGDPGSVLLLAGGELEVVLEDGFTLPPNSFAYVLFADTVSGTFSTVTGPSNMEVTYEPDRVRLFFAAPSCNAADLSEPFGVLDLGDIALFIDGFKNQDPIADLVADGIFDLADLGMFVSEFIDGCP